MRRCLIMLAMLCLVPVAVAQQTGSDWAWKPLVEQGGVELSYIYYDGERQATSSGVVFKLVNRTDRRLAYRFVVIFRAPGKEAEQEVTGQIDARAIKVGDADGLYWQPFAPGHTVGEIGLRGLKVDAVPPQSPLGAPDAR